MPCPLLNVIHVSNLCSRHCKNSWYPNLKFFVDYILAMIHRSAVTSSFEEEQGGEQFWKLSFDWRENVSNPF